MIIYLSGWTKVDQVQVTLHRQCYKCYSTNHCCNTWWEILLLSMVYECSTWQDCHYLGFTTLSTIYTLSNYSEIDRERSIPSRRCKWRENVDQTKTTVHAILVLYTSSCGDSFHLMFCFRDLTARYRVYVSHHTSSFLREFHPFFLR